MLRAPARNAMKHVTGYETLNEYTAGTGPIPTTLTPRYSKTFGRNLLYFIECFPSILKYYNFGKIQRKLSHATYLTIAKNITLTKTYCKGGLLY